MAGDVRDRGQGRLLLEGGKVGPGNAHARLPWINRLHLRGERTLGATTQLFFRYKLTGAETLQVALMDRTAKETHIVDLKKLTTGKWAEATVDFPAAAKRGDKVDELRFLLPKGAELLVDDVLLFEPDQKP